MSQAGYIPGDFWRICERCGFKTRSSQTFKTWDGLWVCHDDFETRHPQDFVRGRVDRITAPSPRPESIDNVIGPLTTTLTVAATAASTSLTVGSTVRFESGDFVGIVSNSGTIRKQINNVVSETNFTITTALSVTAAVGAVVINYSAVAEADIG